MGYQSSSRVFNQRLEGLYSEFQQVALSSPVFQDRQGDSGSVDKGTSDKVALLDIEIDNVSKADLLHRLTQGVVFTPNVDHLMRLRRDPEFFQAYQQADYKVCDSQILKYAAQFLGQKIKDKISGSDLFPWFCEYHKDHPEIRIFLLGAQAGIAQKAQANINARIGREIIVAAHSPSFGFEHSEPECEAILELIRNSGANVLVVGVGAPKQEKWIVKYKDQLPTINIFMAVGAAIDFEAGYKPRAPQFVSELGLEWLYRLLSEPKRLWKRYLLDDLPFLGLVLREKVKQLS